MTAPAHRPLGRSQLTVSPLALGSWRTFERIGADAGLSVMLAARDVGITFLDDARYNDETGTAPIPTGYSEVLFGELFRLAGWRRDHTVVANKLWWEFWPEQSAADELDASLQRMGFDYVDLIYANPPENGLGLEELVRSVAALVAAGKARAWGIVNWPASMLAEAVALADATGAPPPCAAQLPYSLVRRDWVESDEMTAALAACGAPVVASYSLAGGVLSGKYAAPDVRGRAAGTLEEPGVARAAAAAQELAALAHRWDTTPAALAIAFAASNPNVASVLFGATSPAQLLENAAAPAVLARLSPAERAELQAVGR